MAAPSQKLTDYELERAERIRRNREELARLTAGLELPTAVRALQARLRLVSNVPDARRAPWQAPAYRGGAATDAK